MKNNLFALKIADFLLSEKFMFLYLLFSAFVISDVLCSYSEFLSLIFFIGGFSFLSDYQIISFVCLSFAVVLFIVLLIVFYSMLLQDAIELKLKELK